MINKKTIGLLSFQQYLHPATIVKMIGMPQEHLNR